jgi:hypothetical protein
VGNMDGGALLHVAPQRPHHRDGTVIHTSLQLEPILSQYSCGNEGWSRRCIFRRRARIHLTGPGKNASGQTQIGRSAFEIFGLLRRGLSISAHGAYVCYFFVFVPRLCSTALGRFVVLPRAHSQRRPSFVLDALRACSQPSTVLFFSVSFLCSCSLRPRPRPSAAARPSPQTTQRLRAATPSGRATPGTRAAAAV